MIFTCLSVTPALGFLSEQSLSTVRIYCFRTTINLNSLHVTHICHLVLSVGKYQKEWHVKQ